MIGHETTETQAAKIGDCNNILAAPLVALLAGFLSVWPFFLVGIMIVGPIWAVWYARKCAITKEEKD